MEDIQTTGAPRSMKLPTNKRNFIYLVCCLTTFIVWMDELTFSNLTPYWSDHFSFSPVEISSVAGAYVLGYALSQIYGGILADKFGARKIMLICVAGVIVMSLMIFLCKDYASMYIRNIIFGSFFGLFWGPCNKHMGNWLPAHERGSKSAVWGTLCGASGLVAAPLALFIAARTDWRYAFIVMVILAVPLFIMILKTTDNPADFKGISKEELDYINAGRDEEALKAERISFRGLGTVMKDPNIWVACFAIVVSSASTWMSATWMSMVLIKGYGVDAQTAGAMISPMTVIPVLIGLTVGWTIRKIFNGNIKLIFMVPAVVGAVCFIIPTYIYVSPLVATLLITGFAVGGNAWGFGGGNTYFAAYTKPKYWGTLNGLAAGLQGLTGFVMVSISGRWVSDDAALGGYGNIFLYTGLFWLVGIILTIVAKKRLLGDTWETAGGLKA